MPELERQVRIGLRAGVTAGLLLLALSAFASAASDSALIWIPPGDFTQGRFTPAHPDQAPPHRVHIRGFSLDATLVTVADYQAFVARTGYRTTAEKLGYGLSATEGMENWDWARIPGASWRQPFGAAHSRDIPLLPDDPVVMVSWVDADAYCTAQGMRLPTEAEWEYAARAGATTRFPWGETPLLADGGYGLNFWQGDGHEKNDLGDGYRYLSPVRAFPPNRFGMYDPVGNVWQWTADWYDPQAYAEAADAGVADDPEGPDSGTLKVARGGSWWCSKTTCNGYGLFYRGKAKPTAPFSNNGFRCARDGPRPASGP